MYTAWLGQSDHIVEKPCTVAFVVFVVSVLLVLCVVCNVYRQATDIIIIRMNRDDKTSTGDFCITIRLLLDYISIILVSYIGSIGSII